LLGHHVPLAVWCARWHLSLACLYAWPKAFVLPGLDSLVSQHGGGRQPQLPPTQQQRLGALLAAGPLGGGGDTACWNAVRRRVLIWRACGGLSNRPDVCTWRHHLGVSFPKARLVSEPLDEAQCLAWLAEKWPAIFRAAQRRNALLL